MFRIFDCTINVQNQRAKVTQSAHTQVHNWHKTFHNQCAKVHNPCAKRANVDKSDNQCGQDCVRLVEVEHQRPSSIVRLSGHWPVCGGWPSTFYYAMHCNAVRCNAMQCNEMPCNVILCYFKTCRAICSIANSW